MLGESFKDVVLETDCFIDIWSCQYNLFRFSLLAPQMRDYRQIWSEVSTNFRFYGIFRVYLLEIESSSVSDEFSILNELIIPGLWKLFIIRFYGQQSLGNPQNYFQRKNPGSGVYPINIRIFGSIYRILWLLG